MTRKVLYSPGYGAGWTSWECDPETKRYMLTYQPIIDFLETGHKFTRRDCDWPGNGDYEPRHPLLRQLKAECREKFGTDPYVGGAHQLRVVEVEGQVKIEEYDGSESYLTRGADENEWM